MFEPEIVTEINKDNESINKCVLLGYEKIPEENEFIFKEKNINNSSINDEKSLKEKIMDYKNKITDKIEEINEYDEIKDNNKYNINNNNNNGKITNITPYANFNDNYFTKIDNINTFSDETKNKNKNKTGTNKNNLRGGKNTLLQNYNKMKIIFPNNTHYNHINNSQDRIYSNNDYKINEKISRNKKKNKTNKNNEKKYINLNKNRNIKKNDNNNKIDFSKSIERYKYPLKDIDNENKIKLIKKNKSIDNNNMRNKKNYNNNKDNKKEIIIMKKNEDIINDDNQQMEEEIIQINKKPENLETKMKYYKNPFESNNSQNDQIKEMIFKFILTKEEYLILMREKSKFNNLLIA